MALPEDATGIEPSVEDRLEAFFSAQEDTEPSESATDSPESESEEVEQEDDSEPSETSEDESDEQSEETEEEAEEAPAPPTFKVKVDGEETEVTLDELLKGYSRTADYTRKTQAHAAERKAFETEAAQTREARQQYAAGLSQIEQALRELAPTEPDWNKLKHELPPAEYSAAWIEWQQHQDRINQVADERKKQEDVLRKEFEDQRKAFISAEREKLLAAFPEWKDAEKARTAKTKLSEFAQKKGFTVQELENSDSRAIILLNEAMLYHELKAKQKQVTGKVTEQIKAAAPGAGKKAPPKKVNEYMRAKERLAKSGGVEDAADLLYHAGLADVR
jgi:hypothetical protein